MVIWGVGGGGLTILAVVAVRCGESRGSCRWWGGGGGGFMTMFIDIVCVWFCGRRICLGAARLRISAKALGHFGWRISLTIPT